MGRGKLTLEFISKDRSRRTTFEKRKKGLMKKAEEFSILCGVDTCMIIYGPDDTSDRGPTVWPLDSDKAKQVIDRYLNEGVDRRKRNAMGLPEFFMNRKRKLDGELARLRTANWAAKYPVSDELINGLNQDQLQSLLSVLGARLENAKHRLLAVREGAARNPSGMRMEEFTFNGSAIQSSVNVNDCRQFVVPLNMMCDEVKPPLEFPPLMISPYLPPLMDSGSVMNGGPMMWSSIGNSSTNANNSIHNHQNNNTNNNYCWNNYALTAPTYGISFHHQSSTDPSKASPFHQYDQMHGVALPVPENALMDYQGMLGNGPSMMMIPHPQQQSLPMQYPGTMMQQGLSLKSSMFMPTHHEKPQLPDNYNNSNDQFFSPN